MLAVSKFQALGPAADRRGKDAKSAILSDALQALQHLIVDSAGVRPYSIPQLLDDVFSDKADPDLEKLRAALRPNKAYFFQLQKQGPSATGEKLLAYLAAIHNPDCLQADGSVNVRVTQATIRWLLNEPELSLDPAAIQNMKLGATNVYGKHRRSDVKPVGLASLDRFRAAIELTNFNNDARRRKALADMEAARNYQAQWLQNGGVGLDAKDAPGLCMMLDLEAVPKLKSTHTVHDATEIEFGDVHGNFELLGHMLVTTGFWKIVDESKYKALMHFVKHAVPALSAQQLNRMEELKRLIAEVPLKPSEVKRWKELKASKNKSEAEANEFEALNARNRGDLLQQLRVEYQRLNYMRLKAEAPGVITYSEPFEYLRQLRTLMEEAVVCSDQAAGCRLTLAGDLFCDGGENDLPILMALDLLPNRHIIFSNHDAEFILWLLKRCSFNEVRLQESNGSLIDQKKMGFADDQSPNGVSGSKYQSTVPLDTMCQQDPAFREEIQALAARIYLTPESLRLASTSLSGGVLFTHTCASKEKWLAMVKWAVPHALGFSTEQQVKALNAWFAGVIADPRLYVRETAWKGQSYDGREVAPLIDFVTSIGFDLEYRHPAQVDLELPTDMSAVVHGHTPNIAGLTPLGDIDPVEDAKAKGHGLSSGMFRNVDQAKRYFSIDGEVGAPMAAAKGPRMYYAELENPAAGTGSDASEQPPEGALKV